MKKFIFFALNFIFTAFCVAQNGHDLIFPDSVNWNILHEGKPISLKIKATNLETFQGFSIDNPEQLPVKFDSTGNFSWTPSFNLVNRVEQKKDFTIFFEGHWAQGNRVCKTIAFTVNHVNQPPIVEELPVFYVKQSTQNTYQILGKYISDPDGDPFVYKIVPLQLPEGATLSSSGQLTWTPSRSQFNALKNNPLTLEFAVQDQPDKAETKGKIRIAQTQLDLPPELFILPGDSVFKIKEDETLNLKIYVSDPNGDDNVRSAGFVSSDPRIQISNLKENTPLQYEFTWLPSYSFVSDAQKKLSVDVTFFVLDKTGNRAQRKINIQVTDTENVEVKDAHQYQKYLGNLTSATLLIRELDKNQKKLNEDYKKAKKGKKKRSVVTASLGAVTGFSPLFLDPSQSQVVSGVGGTTVLTLSTLEATEVMGKSKDDIMEKIKINIDIRNKVQNAGDEFARKYALKSARREADFEKEIEKLRGVVNDQRIVLLELEAYKKLPPKVDVKEVQKNFPDFSAGD